MDNSALKALIDDSINNSDSSSYGATSPTINYGECNELSSGCSERYEEASSIRKNKKRKCLPTTDDKKKKMILISTVAVVILMVALVVLIVELTLGERVDNNLADLIILNSVPYSVAIKGNKILRIGTAGWVQKKYESKKTILIDASGVNTFR